MITHDQHIYNIGYRGGSGGFLFLHFLLLSEQYCTDMFDNPDFSNVTAQHWNIIDHNRWKSTEVQPNNTKVLNSNSELDKIIFFCNPSQQEFFQKKQQVDLAIKCYNDIADANWPVLHSLEDFINLPDRIYQEIHSTLEYKTMLQYLRNMVPTKSLWLYTDFNSQNELAYYKKAYFYHNQPTRDKIQDFEDRTELWNGVTVDQHSVYFLNHSNIQIKLQNLVNTPDSLIDYGLINKVNQAQCNLLNHWKSLHPPELLKKIGIT